MIISYVSLEIYGGRLLLYYTVGTVLLAREKVVESLLHVLYFLIGARPQLNMFLQSFAIV